MGMAAVLGGVMFGSRATAEEPGPIRWHETYAAALERAKATGKPMLIEFR